MNKVLVLGTVDEEVPLVKALQSLGYYVIVVGREDDYPCCKVADEFMKADVMDKQMILEIAKREKVIAVTSNIVERAIRVAAWVSEQLNLEGIGYNVARLFTNKYLMRKKADEIGVAVPQFREVSNVDEAIRFVSEVGYPVIIKPEDNGGSKGVQKITSERELYDRFKFSLDLSVNEGKVIIEQYVEGEEYIVNAFTHNYICENTDVAFKEKFALEHNFVSKAVVLQDSDSSISDIELMLKKTNKQIVEGFGLKYGITHGEYIIGKNDGRVYLVEITARGGGVYLCSTLTPASCGIDVNELLARQVVGKGMTSDERLKLTNGASAWYAFALPQGKIVKVDGIKEAEKIFGVIKIYADKIKVGMIVSKLIDDSGKFGPILIKGKTRQECYEIFEKVKQCINIEVETDKGIMGIIW